MTLSIQRKARNLIFRGSLGATNAGTCENTSSSEKQKPGSLSIVKQMDQTGVPADLNGSSSHHATVLLLLRCAHKTASMISYKCNSNPTNSPSLNGLSPRYNSQTAEDRKSVV